MPSAVPSAVAANLLPRNWSSRNERLRTGLATEGPMRRRRTAAEVARILREADGPLGEWIDRIVPQSVARRVPRAGGIRGRGGCAGAAGMVPAGYNAVRPHT